jgi:hypothetical protein
VSDASTSRDGPSETVSEDESIHDGPSESLCEGPSGSYECEVSTFAIAFAAVDRADQNSTCNRPANTDIGPRSLLYPGFAIIW